MAVLTKRFYGISLIFISLFFLASCSTGGWFTPSEDPKAESSDQAKMTGLETELADIKDEQAQLTREIQDKDTAIEQLKVHISRLETKLADMEKQTPPPPKVEYKIEYTEPADLYKKARNLFLEGSYSDAATIFSEFIKRHPKDELTDNAAYWLGECYYSLEDYNKAIQVFKELTALYPKSEKVPDAMLKIGYAYMGMDDTNRAHHFLKQVLTQYPFSPAAEKAEEKLGDFD